MLNYELVKCDWFDADALRLPDYQVGRVSYGNGRSYLRIRDGELEQPFRLYTSLTTAINQCAPMERPLLEWYCKLGLAEADRQLKISQHYGTLMHMLLGSYLINNFFDFDGVKDTVNGYVISKGLTFPECKEWEQKLKYDVAAFISFAQQSNIIPLGIEYVLLSDKGYGTLIDLVCKMDVEEKGFFGEVYKSGASTGQPKETKRITQKTCIINFKSGRHGFYRSNGIQIELERQLFEENFPDIKIECAINWSPKDWTVSPSWNLKDWTGEIEQSELDAILTLAEIRFGTKAVNKKYIDISGMAFKQRDVLTENIHTIGVEDYCKQRYSEYL